MTTEQLKRATELSNRIYALKVNIKLISEPERTLVFKQYSESNYELSIKNDDKDPIDEQLRIVLQATKQTIKSIIEREIEKLEVEFGKL